MRTKPARRSLKRQVLFLSVAAALQPAAFAQTLPTGGQVTHGLATISQSPTSMQIDQASAKAVLEWQSFSIGVGARVHFQQQGPASVALNRVLGNNPSEIFGSLTASGRVFLVNPSGVYFAPGASVSVGGLVASTLSISDEDFLAGRYVFSNGGGAGSVVNDGSISSHSGYTALLGTRVENNGSIVANAGSVALAAGDRVSLDMVGDNLIRVSVDQAAMNAAVLNRSTGSVQALGGNVLLSVSSANALLDTVLNTEGIVRASGFSTVDGQVVLSGGPRGTTALSGDISSTGAMRIDGDHVVVAADGGRTALLVAGGQQTVDARSLAITANGGGNATLTSFGAGQTINVAGGNLSIHARDGGTIDLTSQNGDQVIAVRDGDLFSLSAADTSRLFLNAFQNGQSWSITGSGENAMVLGGEGTTGSVFISASSQHFTAGVGGESGSITVHGPSAEEHSTQISTFPIVPSPDSEQTIATTGALRVLGGARAAGLPFLVGFVHSGGGAQRIAAGSMELRGGSDGAGNPVSIISTAGGGQHVELAGALVIQGGQGGGAGLHSSGAQRIKAASILVQGGSAGVNNGAFITTDPGVSQHIEVPGRIEVIAGAGTGNGAGINSRGSQTIIGRPDIVVQGGSGTNATIQGLGAFQRIEANSLFITNGENSPQNSAGVIQGAHQRIDVTGDVTLIGRSGTGSNSGSRIGAQGAGATDLMLTLGGNLLLQGGTTGTNGAGLGGTGNGATNRNDIVVVAQGDVILDGAVGGGGVRIGSSALTPVQDGNVSITARSILFTGTAPAAIRTLGDVTLSAGSIRQEPNGLVLASGLTTTSEGSTTLAGANRVARYGGTSFAGDIALKNIGTLEVGQVTANGAMDVQVSGGNLEVGPGGQLVATGDQSIRVIDGDRIAVQGGDTFAGILSGGSQTISITGSGQNAIILGSAGAEGTSVINALQQRITAGHAGEQGSITLTGPDSFSGFVGITTQSGLGAETQSVSTSGALRVLGGNAPAKSSSTPTGIFHNRQGTQSVSAAGIEIRGGASGIGNHAFVNSNGGGDQEVALTGALELHGDAGGNAGMGVNPGAFSSRRGHQTIDAGSILLTNALGGGGFNASASITALTQDIRTIGDVRLQAGASGGDVTGVRIGGRGGEATNLSLAVGGDLVFTGGLAGNNGAAIGGSSAGLAAENFIDIVATGEVILDGGSDGAGVRIGSSTRNGIAGGDVAIDAAAIRFIGSKPAAIRTLGTVALNAGEIVQGANGLIVASTLGATSQGATLLDGANEVSSYSGSSATGDIRLRNVSSLLTLGDVDATGTLSIDHAGSLLIQATDAPIVVRGGLVNVATGADLLLVGGSADGAQAVLSSGGNVDLTVGGTLRLDEGSGKFAAARIQTESKDGAIRLAFPNLSSGGFYVNGVEGDTKDGKSGFFIFHRPAKLERDLVLEYGE